MLIWNGKDTALESRMGYCRNTPEVLRWKQPGLECVELSDLPVAGRGMMVVGLWRIWGLCLRLKDLLACTCTLHTPCPTFQREDVSEVSWAYCQMCYWNNINSAPPRICRCPLTTCWPVLWQRLACRKEDEKLEALVCILVPSFILKYVPANTAVIAALWFFLLSPSPGSKPAEQHCKHRRMWLLC